jgi:hypothetical protein
MKQYLLMKTFTMKLQLIICAAFAFFLTGLSFSYGQKIYLSPDGQDGNPGTAEKPLATLSAARDKARELKRNTIPAQSIEIIALDGEYFMFQPLILTSDDSGTSDFPLTFKAETGNLPVFRGGVKLTGIEKVNESLWRVFVPQVAWYDSYFEQLYVNGRRAVRARTPDKGFFNVKNASETVLVWGRGSLPKLAVQEIQLDPAGTECLKKFTGEDYRDAVITFYHKWDNTMKHVAGFNDSTSSIRTFGTGMQPWNSIDGQTRYYIDNCKSALNAPGEWYLDRSGYLYYIPMKGETIENTTLIAPVLKEFILVRGDSITGKRVTNIHFENLDFEVAGYSLPSNGNEAMQAASPIGAVITLDFADNISFQNCEVAHTGTWGFWFRRACSNCTVSHTYLHDLGAGGIKIGETDIRQVTAEITNHIIVDNNIIRNCGNLFPCAVGVIIFNASDNKLTHNEIADLRYSGISVGWVWGYTPSPSKRNMVEFNHIHHLGWGELSDMGGVYTLGASEGTTVSNNVIHHVYALDYGGWGLYTDEGSYGIKEENNLVYACKSSGFHQHYGKENIIRNNIFALNIRAQLQATRIEDHRSISFTNNIIYFNSGSLMSSNWHKFSLLSDYNCYWDTRTKNIDFGKSFADWKKSGKDVHSIITDPHFVNPEAFDFHFRDQSIAKKIKFVPFDYSRAGVYGSEEWKKLAEFDPDLASEFDKIVLQGETLK